MVSVFLATLVVPFVVAFLVFLWSNPEGGTFEVSWRRFVVNDLIIKAITVSSLIIRSAVSIQATAATSMLAAILLERYETPVYASASVFTIRYMNTGPQSLLFATYDSVWRNKGIALVTLLLLTTTTLLQFTSTVLAFDLGYGNLITPTDILSISTGMSLDHPFHAMRDAYVDMWAVQPPEYPTFADLRESGPIEELVDGMRDTGIVIRAFLPISNSTERRVIERFDGVATLLDSRMVFVRPTTHSSLSIGYSPGTGFFLNGTLRPAIGRAGAQVTESPNSITLNITDKISGNVPSTLLDRIQRLPFAVNQAWWPIIQKGLSTEAPALVSALDPRYPTVVSSNSSEYYANNTNLSCFANNFELTPGNLTFGVVNDTVPFLTGRSYLLFNISLSADVTMLQTGKAENSDNFFFFNQQDSLNGVVVTNESEWLKLEIPRIPGWRLSTTLCFDSIVSANVHVSVGSNGTVKEPSLGAWDSSARRFSTHALREQLGVHSGMSQDSPDRGVMTLLSSTDELRERIQPWYDESKSNGWKNMSWPYQNFVYRKIRSQRAYGITMCSGCPIQWGDPGQPAAYQSVNDGFQNLIFQDTLLDTSDVALALQAHYTSIARTAYYSISPYFDIEDQRQLSSYKAYQFPQSVWD